MPTPDRTSLMEIVEAGRDLVETSGAARLTMQAVAERVGVRPPSLYKRVRDRDALLLLVAQAAVDDLARRLTASDGTLAGLAHAYRGFAHERPQGFRLLFTVDGAAESLHRVAPPCCDSRTSSWGRMLRSRPHASSRRGRRASSRWSWQARSVSAATSIARSRSDWSGSSSDCADSA